MSETDYTREDAEDSVRRSMSADDRQTRHEHNEGERGLRFILDALAAAERELAGVRKFAGDILQEADDASDVGGDVGGDVVQERALACGLLRSETRTEPCDSEDCACSEYGFPITCYRYTELGLACIRAANHASEVDDA